MMNRFVAIACLVGAIFAMGALAAKDSAELIADIERAEQKELVQNSKYILKLADDLTTHNYGYGIDGKELVWVPIMKHLLRTIERTRSKIISKALKKSKGSATIKEDLIDAHYRAYREISGELVEFGKAVTDMKAGKYIPELIENLAFEGIKRVEAYKL